VSLLRRAIAVLLSASSLCAAVTVQADPLVARTPSTDFDLSRWKLTLPRDFGGGIHGDASEVASLQGYAQPPYFYSAADGGMVFWAPVDGATTGGSNYPRSELREMQQAGNAAVNWTSADNAALEARLKIDRVPAASGKLVVGQIHGYGVAPLVKLQYEIGGGKLSALINPTPTSSIPLKFLLASGVPLNHAFDYRIAVVDDVLTLSAAGGKPLVYSIDARWQPVGLYFKAGAYVQASGSDSRDGGQATFYRLQLMHPMDAVAVH
jgi:hypothetical protein